MNAPDKLPPMNVAVVLHTGGKSSAFNPAAGRRIGWHDGVRWCTKVAIDCADVAHIPAGNVKGWSLIDAGLPEPRDLAEIWHEATRKHDGGLAQWEDQPEWCRERDAAVAAAVIAKLLRGG